jgi:hypothetical protein
MNKPSILRRFADHLWWPPPPSRRVHFEFAGFLAALRKYGVRSYLEVGAYQGGTVFRVMRSLPTGSFGVTVDDDSRNTLS